MNSANPDNILLRTLGFTIFLLNPDIIDFFPSREALEVNGH